MFAAQNGHEQVALVLLKAKADPKKATKRGTTALYLAKEQGYSRISEILEER